MCERGGKSLFSQSSLWRFVIYSPTAHVIADPHSGGLPHIAVAHETRRHSLFSFCTIAFLLLPSLSFFLEFLFFLSSLQIVIDSSEYVNTRGPVELWTDLSLQIALIDLFLDIDIQVCRYFLFIVLSKWKEWKGQDWHFFFRMRIFPMIMSWKLQVFHHRWVKEKNIFRFWAQSRDSFVFYFLWYNLLC